jgi:hypothetical protein
MKFKYGLLSILLLITTIHACLGQTSGFWVAQKVDEREKGEDASLQMDMVLIDKKGRERERRLFIIRKDFDGNDKLLLKFTYPNDIRGTSFLVWEHEERDNERFLYLPALGRVRRIATSEKDENFAGTDFSYEDISGRKLQNYTYRLLEEEVMYENTKCYLLASYPKEANAKFPMIHSWIRKDNFVVIKADYYNNKEEIEKTFHVLKLDKVDGIWTSLELLMENHEMNHKTFSKITHVVYNQGIQDTRFDKKELMK